MTMKKRILIIAASVCVLLSLTLLFGFTTEPAATQTAYAATVDDGAEPPAETVDETDNPTFLGRVGEWLNEHKVEIVTILTDIVMFVMLIYNPVKSKKSLLRIGKDTSFTNNSQSEVIGGLNNLIENYNAIEKKITSYENTESERYKFVAAMVVQTRAVLDILATVYANSKNLPQGVKDLVNLKYADVLKTTSDDEKLLSVEMVEMEQEPEAEKTEE